MRRVSVVGTSGSGKSTLGAALAKRLGAGFLELDSVYHQPGWVPLPRDEFRARADTVVWLDLPRRTVMRRIIWRSFLRAARRQELWNGNRERWRNFFSADREESVIAWAWQTHAATRAKYAAAMADTGYAQLHFVRLKNPAEVRRFLRSAPEAGPRSGAD